jgi:hypothetical protein
LYSKHEQLCAYERQQPDDAHVWFPGEAHIACFLQNHRACAQGVQCRRERQDESGCSETEFGREEVPANPFGESEARCEDVDTLESEYENILRFHKVSRITMSAENPAFFSIDN